MIMKYYCNHWNQILLVLQPGEDNMITELKNQVDTVVTIIISVTGLIRTYQLVLLCVHTVHNTITDQI